MVKLEIKYIAVDTLQPYIGNSKVHPEEQILELMGLIEKFGFIDPLLVRQSDSTIIAGHGRLAAAIRLKMNKVPVIYVDHLSDREMRALVIAHNKSSEKGRWDLDILSEEINSLISEDFDVSILGFDEQSLDALLKDDISFLPESVKKKSIMPKSEKVADTSYENKDGNISYESRTIKIKFASSKQMQEAEVELKKLLEKFEGVEYSVVLR